MKTRTCKALSRKGLLSLGSALRVGEEEAGAAAAGDGGALDERVEEGVLRGHQAPPPARHPPHCGPSLLLLMLLMASLWRLRITSPF